MEVKRIANIMNNLGLMQKMICLAVFCALLSATTTKVSADYRDFEIDKSTLIRYHGSEEEIIIPKGITHIHTSAFEGNTTLKSVHFPDSLVHIGNGAFNGCKNLRRIDFPANLEIIGKAAFKDCDSLEEVSLSGGIRLIEASAFYDCDALKTVMISSNVQAMGYGVFSQCRNLQSIYVSDSNKNYMEQDGVLFNGDGTVLIQFPIGYKKTRYSVPAGTVEMQ